MKNFKISCLLTVFVLAFIISCDKSEGSSTSDLNTNTENSDLKQNEATWISSNDNSKESSLIRIKIFLGHTAADCGNACVKIFGEPVHLDCRGTGNVCNHNVTVRVSEETTNGEFMLTLTDEDAFGDFEIFPFPNRTLRITNPQNNSELWLNIPEQTLLKNNSDKEIIIYDAWFSEMPELEND
jgi:hypothetical protein